MFNKKGVTLITLVVTIIVLLLLAGLSISIVIGPDGVIAKARQGSVASRYSQIRDLEDVRKTDLILKSKIGEKLESDTAFITRLETMGLIKESEDEYDEDTKVLSIGNGLYTINIMAGDKEEVDLVAQLPTVEDNPEMAHMTFVIRITEPNQTFPLYISDTTNITIDWGMGEGFEPTTNQLLQTKEFPAAGDYTIKIAGKSNEAGFEVDFNFNNYPFTGDPYMTELIYWGENDFAAIGYLSNQLEHIPLPSRNSFASLKYLGGTFARSQITNIPEALFANAPNLEGIINVFAECKQLTQIPPRLFDNALNIESFEFTFADCDALTGLAPELWLRETTNPDINGVGCFDNCTSLSNYDDIPSPWKSNPPQ